jgi:hypothetical protein
MTTRSTRRAVLAGFTTLPATTPAFGVSNVPDPIYAAIAAHRQAVAAYHAAAGDAQATMHAGDVMDETARALGDVQPTTIAGVIAFLSYIAECLGDNGGGWQFPGGMRLHILIRAAAAALERFA